MQKSTKLGIGCMVAPPVVFILVLALWMVISLLGSSVQGDQAATTARMFNVGLGLLGIVCLLSLPIGIVVGMILLLKKKDSKGNNSSNAS